MSEREIEQLKNDINNLEKEVNSLKTSFSKPEAQKNPLSRYTDLKSKDLSNEVTARRIYDTWWNDIISIQTYYDSIDNWNQYGGFGSLAVQDGVLFLVSGSAASGVIEKHTGAGVLRWDKEQRFRVNLQVSDVREGVRVECFIGGVRSSESPGSGFGFIIWDDELYGQASNISEDKTSYEIKRIKLSTILPVERYVVEARLVPGERVDFYVQEGVKGTLEYKGSITDRLPKNDNSGFYVGSTLNGENEKLFTIRIKDEGSGDPFTFYSYFIEYSRMV